MNKSEGNKIMRMVLLYRPDPRQEKAARVCKGEKQTTEVGMRLYQRSGLEVSSENRVPHIANDRLRRLGIYNAGQMSIQDPTVLIIPSMNLKEVGSEVLHNSFVFVCAVAEG